MRREKKTEVFVETEVEIEFRGRTRRLAPVWCGGCGAQVEMAPPDVAAAVAGVSARAVYGWVEAGRVHFCETAEGALLVCLNSLPAAADAAAAGLADARGEGGGRLGTPDEVQGDGAATGRKGLKAPDADGRREQ